MSMFSVEKKRLSFQRVGGSSLHCCVPQCTCSSRYNSNVSFHSFPADNAARQQWLAKIRRENFSPSRSTRVCRRHFLPGDIVDTPGKKRWLKKGAIPILFEWNNYMLPESSSSVWERKPREEKEIPAAADLAENMEVVALDHDYCVSPSNGVTVKELLIENKALRKQRDLLRTQVEGLQLRSCFFLERFAGSDDEIRFYTRFASYRHFQYFWKLVEPAVKNKMICITDTEASTAGSEEFHTSMKLPPIDELFLFLMFLSLGLPLQDLGERFGVHQTAVSRILRTWATFLYFLLGGTSLWLPPEVVRAQLPAEFASCSDTQVVLVCTEIHCETPSSLQFQSDVSHSTFKALVGLAPHGAITFVSSLFAGSMNDLEIFKQSGILNVLQADMAIMVDRGFLVDSLAPCKAYRLGFRPGRDQMSSQVRDTPSIAHLRVHIERCVRRLKDNTLFDRVLPVTVYGVIEELFLVNCFLVNYQNGLLVKSWAA